MKEPASVSSIATTSAVGSVLVQGLLPLAAAAPDDVGAAEAVLSEARRRMGELEQLASADPLLGILNRRAFVAELNRALAMTQRYGQPSSLVFVDVNDLKKINDSHGHAAGDAALAHAAAVISAMSRKVGISPKNAKW